MLSKKSLFYQLGLIKAVHPSSMSSYLLVCFKAKETNKHIASTLLLSINILLWLSPLHFHRLVSFVEDKCNYYNVFILQRE